MNLRVEPSLYVAYVAACRRDGLTVSQRIRAHMVEVAGDGDAPPEPPKRVGTEPALVTRIRKEAGRVAPPKLKSVTCTHERLRKLPYGVWCEDCNTRLR